MAIKGKNELKIGILVLVALVALLFGLRFLSGGGLFEMGTDLVAIYDNTSGLQPSSPIMLKGVQIGKVKDISLLPDQRVKVDLYFKKDVKIPKGAIAQLVSQSMISGEKMVSMRFPEKINGYYENNDTIISKGSEDLLDNLSSEVSPMMHSVNSAVTNIDSVTLAVNNILNAQSQVYMQRSFQNLDATLVELAKLSAALNQQTRNLNAIMGNVNGFTGNLNNQNDQINRILSNTQVATNNLTGPEIKNTLASLEASAQSIETMIAEMKNSNGSLGMLIRDRALYDNLTSTSKSLDDLIKDLKRQPGKYINISVFPGKTKVVEVEKL